MTETYDIIIVGGGVIGCAIARELAPDHDVVIVEQGQIAAEASALAAGEVTMMPSYTDVPEVARHAFRFFQEYDGTGDFEFVECPSLDLVTPDREGEARRRAERLAGEGIDVRFLEAETVAERFPRVDMDEFAGAVEHDETGFVDPYTLSITYMEDAQDRGATIYTDTAVDEVLVEDGAVTGVETDEGTFEAPQVVVATGWRTAEFLADTIELPLRPYRTQIVVLDPGAELDADFPMGWIPGQHVYFRPEQNGDLLVGGWSFAEDDPVGASGQADEEFVDHVAHLLPRFLHDFDRARFVNGWAGIDGATPDTRPIIDMPADAPDGMLVATGFHGRGIMTSPVAATLARSLLTDESCPFPAEEFALGRFESCSPDFEFQSISAG